MLPEIFLKKIVSIFLLVQALNSAKANLGVSPDEAQVAVNHLENIFRVYPPNEYAIVCLGQSCSVFSALTELYGPFGIENKYFFEAPLKFLMSSRKKDSAKFVSTILPPPAAIAGRKIVFFRVLQEGMSINTLFEHLDKVRLTNWTYHLLHSQRSAADHVNTKVQGEVVFDPLLDYINKSYPDSWKLREHSRFLPFSPAEIDIGNIEIQKNPKFSKLVAHLGMLRQKKSIELDAGFNSYLSEKISSIFSQPCLGLEAASSKLKK